MAEESISLPVTPDFDKPGGCTSRRNSTGKVGSTNRGGEVLSRYLRASTGSCHDLCKHGKKIAVEDEARNPKRLTAKQHRYHNSLESLKLSDKRVSSAVKLETSSDSRHCNIPDQETSISSSPTINPREDEASLAKKTSALNSEPRATKLLKQGQLPKSLRQGESLSAGKIRISLEDVSPKVNGKGLSRNNSNLLKFKSRTEKKLSSLSSPSEGVSGKRTSGTIESRNGKVAATSKVASSKILASPRASLSLRHPVNPSASLPSGKHSSLNVVSSLKIYNKAKKVEESANNELKKRSNDEVLEHTLYVIKTEKEHKTLKSYENENGAVELSSPQSHLKSDEDECHAVELSASEPLSPRLANIKAEEGNTNLKPKGSESCMVESSVLASPSHESSSVPVTPSVSYPSEGAEDNEESVCTGSEVEYDFLSECSETMNVEEVGIASGEQKVPDNDVQPQELRFRRGRVVNIQSDSNNPRRLKFRRGRVLGENQDVKSEGRKSFRKREAVSDVNANRAKEEQVVLRHQDMQGKKDTQVLFNNVIEETASKLVESRKSKVKALVGAFETVISLQESKSSSDIVTANEQVS